MVKLGPNLRDLLGHGKQMSKLVFGFQSLDPAVRNSAITDGQVMDEDIFDLIFQYSQAASLNRIANELENLRNLKEVEMGARTMKDYILKKKG